MLIVDDHLHEEPATPPAEEQEVEEVRIRRIVRERRAQVRTRSYYLVVVLACAVLAVQLVVRLVPAWRSGNIREAVGWIAGAVLLLVVAWSLVGRVRELTHEINTSALPTDTPPPSFEGLSDGSQHRRNLEKLDGRQSDG